MKTFITFSLVAMFLVLSVTPAFAGVIGTVKGWLTGEVIAVIATAVLGIICGTIGLLFSKISRTFKEAGEFLSTLGTAIEDRKMTREEIASIIKEGRDVFAVWGKG